MTLRKLPSLAFRVSTHTNLDKNSVFLAGSHARLDQLSKSRIHANLSASWISRFICAPHVQRYKGMVRGAHSFIHTADAFDPINQFYQSFGMLHSTKPDVGRPLPQEHRTCSSPACPDVRRVQD